jgi:hypothetical protein
MIDDLDQIVEEVNSGRYDTYEKERAAATAAALALCPDHIKEWLIDCTSDDIGKPHSSSSFGGDKVEWFDVGFNSSHYFTLGVRPDGVFIKKTNGDEYNEECQCWYNATTVRVVTVEEICQSYWGHR